MTDHTKQENLFRLRCAYRDIRAVAEQIDPGRVHNTSPLWEAAQIISDEFFALCGEHPWSVGR